MIALKTKGGKKTLQKKEEGKEPPTTEELCSGETEIRTVEEKRGLKVFVTIVSPFLSVKLKCVIFFIVISKNNDCFETGFSNTLSVIVFSIDYQR